jgi:hypothetical protein
MKDGEVRDLVNQVRDIALEFRDAQQLRARLASVLVPVLLEANPSLIPVTDKTMPEEGTIVLAYSRNHMTPMLAYVNYEWPLHWLEALYAEPLGEKDIPEFYMNIPSVFKIFDGK